MNFLAAFGFSKKPSDSPSRLLVHDTTEGEALFEAQLLTLHSLIADAAIVACCANYVAAGGRIDTLLEGESYLPSRTAQIDDLIAVETHETLRAMPAHLRVLRGNCATAAAATEQVIAQVKVTPGAKPPREALRACAGQWRAFAQLAAQTINALEPEARWRIAGRYSENAILLARLLRAIAEGRWPCVNETGGIERINLPQRRRVPRYELHEKCRVISAGGAFEGVTVDISAGGLGIRTAHTFAMRQDVKVQLESGRRLHGVVAWIKAGRIGIQFLHELVPTDPLLRG